MPKLLFISVFLIATYASQGQQNQETFVKVYGKVLNSADSSAIEVSVLYEKLPYYDDMGMGRSGTNGEFEFALINGLNYNFILKRSGFLESKKEFLVNDEDGDGAFFFTMYMEPGEESELITLKDLIFARGSERITESSFAELDELVSWLDERPNVVIQLEGHTDFAGNADANMKLSQARVEAVREYLLGKGVKKARVLTKAFGGTQPIETARTDEAKALNRRVEVRVIRK